MSLKEITQDLHHQAETTQFAKQLLSGKITREAYAQYLWQCVLFYGLIEMSCERQGFLVNMPGIKRADSIFLDYLEIKDDTEKWLPSAIEYHDYLINMIGDPARKHLIKAHMYVRHMGDLFGGQIIKKQVAHVSKGKFYEFKDVEALKGAIRSELTDDLGDEARVAFEYAIKIMRELNHE
jgi:heme oxygenase